MTNIIIELHTAIRFYRLLSINSITAWLDSAYRKATLFGQLFDQSERIPSYVKTGFGQSVQIWIFNLIVACYHVALWVSLGSPLPPKNILVGGLTMLIHSFLTLFESYKTIPTNIV